MNQAHRVIALALPACLHYNIISSQGMDESSNLQPSLKMRLQACLSFHFSYSSKNIQRITSAFPLS